MPAETIYAQIDHVASTYAREAKELVWSACRGPDDAYHFADDDRRTERSDDHHQHVVVGAVRTVGKIEGKVMQSSAAVVEISDPLSAGILRESFL